MAIILALSVSLLTASPCSEAVPLAQGVQSPCEGILVPSADALRAVRCMQVDLPTCQTTMGHRQKECQIKLDSAAEEQDILLDRISKQDATIGQLMHSNAQPPPWWDSPVLWAGAGVTVGITVTLAILKATAAAQ